MYPSTQTEALGLLEEIGAQAHLLKHLQLVGETASELVAALSEFPSLDFDGRLVKVGAAMHDAGKIVFPSELYGPGTDHEAGGYELLLRHGVSEPVAKCCISHGNYREDCVTFEERLVALADTIWKGKREHGLESLIIDEVVARVSLDKWSVYMQLDDAFEAIASRGDERLERSRSG